MYSPSDTKELSSTCTPLKYCLFEICLNYGMLIRDMIGLDSYSRQVFIYLDPILIYISL